MSLLGITNGAVIDAHINFICVAAAQRIILLSETLDLADLSPEQLVARGFVDPVRLFVKQEPHPKRKINEGRFRLISSVSLIDQLVERVLFGPQNNQEIAQWRSCPSKPGMGLSLVEQAQSVWQDLKTKHCIHPAAEADISGFDWSVQDWELRLEAEMRIELGGFGQTLARATRNRFYCLANSVFQLTDGTLIAQGAPGLMKSGSYCTSSSNSRIRCLMAKIIGSPWCIAMGDDSVEGYVAGAKDLYRSLGHECKDYIACSASLSGELLEVGFCSHMLRENEFYLTTWPKTLYRYLCSGSNRIEELYSELGTNPNWPRIYHYLRQCSRAADKYGQEETKPTEDASNCGRGDQITEIIQSPTTQEEQWWLYCHPDRNCAGGGWNDCRQS